MRTFFCAMLGAAAGALVLLECAHVGHVNGLALILAATVGGLVWFAADFAWRRLAEAGREVDRLLALPEDTEAVRRREQFIADMQRIRDNQVFLTVAAARAER